MTILDHPVPRILNCSVPRIALDRPVVAPAHSARQSLPGMAGRFTSSPWEGLYCEAEPSTEARYDEDGTSDVGASC
jgi:hypothetical protein